MLESLKTAGSRELFERAKGSLLGGVASSLHKSPFDDYPLFLDRGTGSKIYDVDGNEYIDYTAAFGPMILGYCPPAVSKAVVDQIAKGSQFAAPTETLIEVTEKIIKHVPCADLVIYPSTGTEANLIAIRLARAFTGKSKIIKFEGHYHGWTDEQLVSCGTESLKSLGPRNRPWKIMGSAGQREKALEDVIIIPWNDLELLSRTITRHKEELAAVITEPVMLNCEPVLPREGYLQGLRELTRENEILLIFDEVITGFRLCLGGAQGYYGITPDICSFGKAVAAGFQLAGVAGRKEIMESGIHHGGTFNGNPIGIAACKATFRELEKPGFYESMARLTKRLTEGITDLARKNKIVLNCGSIESIWYIAFGVDGPLIDYRDNFKVNKLSFQSFRKGCKARGINLHPSRGRHYLTAAHTMEDVDRTLGVVEEVFKEMRKNQA